MIHPSKVSDKNNPFTENQSNNSPFILIVAADPRQSKNSKSAIHVRIDRFPNFSYSVSTNSVSLIEISFKITTSLVFTEKILCSFPLHQNLDDAKNPEKTFYFSFSAICKFIFLQNHDFHIYNQWWHWKLVVDSFNGTIADWCSLYQSFDGSNFPKSDFNMESSAVSNPGFPITTKLMSSFAVSN